MADDDTAKRLEIAQEWLEKFQQATAQVTIHNLRMAVVIDAAACACNAWRDGAPRTVLDEAMANLYEVLRAFYKTAVTGELR